MAELDITALVDALARLEEGHARYLTDTSDAQIRDGLIQRFEFTYDLAVKTLRRYLVATGPSAQPILEMSYPTLIRTADEAGLVLNGWPRWGQYREDRNITSHTYDETKALQVVAGIPAFIEEARTLRDRLREGLRHA